MFEGTNNLLKIITVPHIDFSEFKCELILHFFVLKKSKSILWIYELFVPLANIYKQRVELHPILIFKQIDQVLISLTVERKNDKSID